MNVSRHAIEKYAILNKIKNWKDEEEQRIIIEEINKLFNKSVPETTKDNPGLVRRIIENGFEEVDYYRNDNLRFVVGEDNTIVTIEKNTFDKSRLLTKRTYNKRRNYAKR